MPQVNEDSEKRPRYQQVRDLLAEMIQARKWTPGEALPSEAEVALTFGVAQGTARQAIAMLAQENVLVRRHGVGTFVYEHTPEEEERRFFRLFDPERKRIGPDGHGQASSGRPFCSALASRTERRELRLAKNSRVWRIARVRLRRGTPFVLERISLPEKMFPGLSERSRLPGALYELYQTAYNVLVVHVEERLSAALADEAAAKALAAPVGAPLLRIERVAFALDGTPVEWRVSHCYLDDARYITCLT